MKVRGMGRCLQKGTSKSIPHDLRDDSLGVGVCPQGRARPMSCSFSPSLALSFQAHSLLAPSHHLILPT